MKIIWCMVPEIRCNRESFLSFWAIFCPLTLLTPPKNKTCKKWNKHLQILSFYNCLPKMRIMWSVLEIWSVTDIIFVILGHFLPFYPTNNPKNQNFEKMKKHTCRYQHFTPVHQKLGSDDVWFLRYDARRMEGWVNEQTNRKSDI